MINMVNNVSQRPLSGSPSRVHTILGSVSTDFICESIEADHGTREQPASHYDIIQEGAFSTVARTWVSIKENEEPQWVVVKSSSTVRKFAREPHDIIKELRLLESISHENVRSSLSLCYNRY